MFTMSYKSSRGERELANKRKTCSYRRMQEKTNIQNPNPKHPINLSMPRFTIGPASCDKLQRLVKYNYRQWNLHDSHPFFKAKRSDLEHSLKKRTWMWNRKHIWQQIEELNAHSTKKTSLFLLILKKRSFCVSRTNVYKGISIINKGSLVLSNTLNTFRKFNIEYSQTSLCM